MKYPFVQDVQIMLAERHGGIRAEITVEQPPPEMKADLTINAFKLAKPYRVAPPVLAAEITEFLQGHADVEAAELAKAFVNVRLKPGALFRDSVGDAAALLGGALLPAEQRRRVLVEFSAPNTNKPQHLGHVRNNTLGQALTALLRAAGHDVVAVNLINDRGIHICKSMITYQRFGNGETPESAGKKGDHLVGDYYVKFDQEFRRQLAALKAARPELAEKDGDELFLETEIGRATQDMLLAWEQGDPAVRALWQTMNGWVIAGFNQTYARMGIVFDKLYLESNTYTLGRDLIQDGLTRGVFQKRADGAVFIDLESDKLGQKVVLRSDGTSVYITQDIGTTLLKQNDLRPDRQIWVVGDEQIHHFKQLFAILRKLGHAWAADCHHLAYGMVNLPTGKMKSREGTVVDADDLFDEMEQLAREECQKRAGDAAVANLGERGRVLGMGALKFMLLKVNAKTTMMFDPNASIQFEGDTGPYVQYAYARISSILRKAGPDDFAGIADWSVLGAPEEKALALGLAKFGQTVQDAGAVLEPSLLANYLLDVARAFSRFFTECPVLKAPTPAQKRARLELCVRTRQVLKAGLDALTIGTLDAM